MWAATLAGLVAIRQSTISSAIPNPQSAMTSWRQLTDADWRGYKNTPVPAGWRFDTGSISKSSPVGDLVSKDEFGDFELELDWKIGEAGNSGIFYRGTEEYEHIYWSAPEYQLLDDIKASDNKTRLTCAGAAYAILPSPAGHLKAIGDWNTALAHRALAERREAARVRAGERRLADAGEGEQVQGLAELRPRAARAHRPARRPRGYARLPQHSDPFAVLIRRSP